MDKTLWDYLLKKTANNLTHIIENHMTRGIVVAGLSTIKKGVAAAGESRELFFPEGGLVNLVHPVTKITLHPFGVGENYWPASTSYWENTEKGVFCYNSLKKRNLKMAS